MGAGSGLPGRSEDTSAILLLVDGLLERLLRSPLMRRTPAQCSPEEQLALAQLLGDLSVVRRLHDEVGAMPQLRVDLLTTYWPEAAALLLPARRGAQAAPRVKARDAGTEGENPSLFDAPAETPAPTAPPQPAASPPPESNDLARLLTEALAESGRALNTTQMLAWLEARGVSATRETVIDSLFRHEDRFRRRGNSQWVAAGHDALG